MRVLTTANDLQNAFLYIVLILLCCYFVCALFYSVQGRMYINMAIALIALLLAVVPENRMKRMMREDCVLHTPAWCWYVYAVLLLALAIWISLRNRDFRKNRITPMTIKDCGDHLPAGICFWKKGGRVIMANQKMQQLCHVITGNYLLNGEEFYKVSAGVLINKRKCLWRMPLKRSKY